MCSVSARIKGRYLDVLAFTILLEVYSESVGF